MNLTRFFRILALYLLNFYTLIIALLTKINALRAEQDALLNATASTSSPALAAAVTELTTLVQTTAMSLPEEEPSRFVRHLPLDQNGMLGLGSVALATAVSVAASTIGFAPSTAPVGSPLFHRRKRQEEEPISTSTPEITTTIPSTTSTSTSTTESQPPTTSAFHGPLLWAVVHPDVGTVGVNKVKAYIETSPVPTQRIMTGQLTQRERHLQRLCWETWVGQVSRYQTIEAPTRWTSISGNRQANHYGSRSDYRFGPVGRLLSRTLGPLLSSLVVLELGDSLRKYPDQPY